MQTLPIEDAFLNICKERDEYLEYYYTYIATKIILQKHYYSYIKDRNPWYTDHGINHINRILRRLFDLLRPHLLTDDDAISSQARKLINTDKMSKKLNAYELYLLLTSVLWHDIGNLYGRSAHEKNINKYFKIAKDFLHDNSSCEWIEKIAKAHSGTKAIESNIDIVTKNEGEFTFYPRFLAALLRFADELDEDKERIGAKIYSEVPEENQIYWFFCKCNNSIKIETNYLPGQTKIAIESSIDKGELFKKYKKKNKSGVCEEIFGIDEYINRIDKINTERQYCRIYSEPRYFKMPSTIELRLRIYDASNYLEEIKFEFNDRDGVTEFFTGNNQKLDSYR